MKTNNENQVHNYGDVNEIRNIAGMIIATYRFIKTHNHGAQFQAWKVTKVPARKTQCKNMGKKYARKKGEKSEQKQWLFKLLIGKANK